jgi:hypothetical protein
MNAQQLHPQRDTLKAFGLGKVDEAVAAQVGQHLEECQACCQQLLELQNDTFVELVRAADTPQGKEFLPAQESVLGHDGQ